MPIPTLTYPQLKSLNPCEESLRRIAKLMGGARKWNGTPITAAQAREAGASFDDIIWVASVLARTNKDVERRLRLWMADCAARVLHVFEKERPTDERPREAIIAARRYARGEIDAAAWAAAWAAARAAAWAAAGAAARAAARAAAWAAARDAAGDAAGAAARAAARAAAGDAAWAAAWAAAGDAARAAARAAAGAAEKAWQYERLIAWLSDPEPDDWPLPELRSDAQGEAGHVAA